MDKVLEETESFFSLAKRFWDAVWAQPHSKEILAAIVCLIALLIVIRCLKKKFAPIKLFNNSAGLITVTPKALDELVQSVCYSMGALNRPSVKIYVRRGKLCMLVSLKLEMGQKLSEVSAELQDELTKACREHLGVEKLGAIDVRIKGFKGILSKPQTSFRPLDVLDEPPSGADAQEENSPFIKRS